MKTIALIFASVVYTSNVAERETKNINMIFLTNETKRPLHFKVECNKKLLKSSETDVNAEAGADLDVFGLGGPSAKAGVEINRKEDYEQVLVNLDGFSTLPLGQTTKESFDPECKTIFISMWYTKTDNEKPIHIMKAKRMQEGSQLTFKDNPNGGTPIWETNRDGPCGGERCGCKLKYCYRDCSFGWCYTTKTREYSGEIVSCEKDVDCRPEWMCGSACTVFPKHPEDYST